MGRSLSQSGIEFHHCYMVGVQVWLPRGNVTYHLGLLALAEGLAKKEKFDNLPSNTKLAHNVPIFATCCWSHIDI